MIGIICGLESETRCLARAAARRGDAALSLQTAPGPDAAAAAARTLIAAGCTGLVSFGTAGALASGLRTGDLLVIDRIVGGPQGDADWAAAAMQRLQPHRRAMRGALAASEAVLATASDRRARRGAQPDALAVDTETAAMASAAVAAGVPWIGLRCVLDTADQDLPKAAQAAFRPGHGIAYGALALALLRRPTDLAGLIRLGRQHSAAVASLFDAALLLLPRFR
ncbi:MAG: hypothetical protein ACFB22_13165 [Rhodothalassiaceae bacterium]